MRWLSTTARPRTPSKVTNRAIGDLDQVIQIDPKNAKALSNRGFGYAADGDHDRAIGDLEQAIQLDPKNAISYTGRCAANINKVRDRSSTWRLQSSNPTRSEKCVGFPQPRGRVLRQS
jgi:tetratricopeptide (TPR) repeat protein